MQLIKYRQSTGEILAIWSSNSRELLAGHVLPEEVDCGYLFREEEPIAVAELVERWRIAAGTLREKDRMMLIAEPEIFVANGEDICLIGVMPPTACTVLINGTSYVLTVDDPLVTLTSTTPQTFVVQLEVHATVWALPLTVVAIEEE